MEVPQWGQGAKPVVGAYGALVLKKLNRLCCAASKFWCKFMHILGLSDVMKNQKTCGSAVPHVDTMPMPWATEQVFYLSANIVSQTLVFGMGG